MPFRRNCGDSFDHQEGLDEHELKHKEETENDLNSHRQKHDP